MSGDVAIRMSESLVDYLADNPAAVAVEQLVDGCKRVYQHRDAIVAGSSIEQAREGLRRARAIEQYVAAKAHKDEARRAARVLETAVGEALGPATHTYPGNASPVSDANVPRQDAHRFRLMASHRDLWWPVLSEKALSRKQVLTLIAEANRPPPAGPGEARVWEADACQWLQDIEPADLLMTDPPYSTDVSDIKAFISEWLPLTFKALKPSGRLFVFIGAYADELGAYFSHQLPKGWQWGVPHAWCYRNAIGPTPEFDFIRNWQCMLTARGPKAPPLRTDRINDLLAGYVENAPDGRHETKLHRWQKPLPLVGRLLRLATETGETVIDPFAGSGTTLIAAKEAGRIGLGCDADPEAVATSIQRGCDEG